MEPQYYYGTGRRKEAVARVRLYPGNGNVTVNDRTFDDIYKIERLRLKILQPLIATDTLGKFDVVVKVNGGGMSGQADAIKHGISRALVVFDENLKPMLRTHGYLTRDSRIKERQKYGLVRARKRKQFRKR